MNNAAIRFVDRSKEKAQFFATLRQRVDQYFRDKNISKHYNTSMVIKTIILLLAYLLPFLSILIFNPSPLISMFCWSVMGFAFAGIGMSIMHDANHGAYSSSHKTNLYLGYTLNLIGGSVFNWKIQHNILHHTYTNIVHVDEDIADKVILRFSPHTNVKWYHQLQFVYAFLFYGIMTLYWALLKDFLQFRRYLKKGLNKNSENQNKMAFAKILLSKLTYFFIFLAMPALFFNISFIQCLTGFLLMHFIAGIVLTIIFQLAHTIEGTTHPLPNAANEIENNWAIHQLNTTVNFSRKNKFLSWYVGGLNFQVEHHLFPTICHVHYPEISEIVKSTCEEYGVPYLENPTFTEALRSHIRTLKRFGKLPAMDEAIA